MKEFFKVNKWAIPLAIAAVFFLCYPVAADVIGAAMPGITEQVNEITVAIVQDAVAEEIAVLNQSVTEQIGALSAKIDPLYIYVVGDMERFVDKQYQKLTTHTDDIYWSDIEYCVDITWPNLPDSSKTPALTEKMAYIQKCYVEYLLN